MFQSTIYKIQKNYNFAFFYKLFSGKFWLLFITLCCLSFTTIFNWFATPLFTKLVISKFENLQGAKSDIWITLKFSFLLMILLWFISEFFAFCGRMLKGAYLMPNMDMKIKDIYFDKILNTAEIANKIETGFINSSLYAMIYNIRSFVNQCIVYFIPNIITYNCVIITIFTIHYKLGLILICHLFINILSFYFISKKLDILFYKTIYSHSKLSSFLIDVMMNISNVILFNRRNFEMKQFNQLQIEENNNMKKHLMFMELYKICFIIFTLSTILFLFSFQAITLYIQSVINLSDLIFAFSMSFMYVNFSYYLQEDSFDLLRQFGTIKSAIKIFGFKNIDFHNEASIFDNQDNEDFKLTGKIEFKDVSFSYNSNLNHCIFNKVNFTIQPKEKIMIIGSSGAGKTTLLNLLLGNLFASNGSVLVDDLDVAFCSLNLLREKIAIISQDNMLFNRTIYDNIKYGNINATEEEVFYAAKKANAHGFIMNLENGYNTLIGESGFMLSGGQKQRINIARAILKNSAIFIFDEPFSSMDVENEDFIMNNINNVMKEKTILIISHKLDIIKNMDKVMIIKNGNVTVQNATDFNLSKEDMYINKDLNGKKKII